MNRRRFSIWFIGTSALVLVLLLIGLIILPHVIDRPGVRQWIRDGVSTRLGTEVGFEQIQLSWLPQPNIVIKELHLSLPGGADSQLKSLTIVPAWTGLFRGRFQIADLTLVSPRIHIALRSPAASGGLPAACISIEAVRRHAVFAVERLTRLGPNLRLSVRDGELYLKAPNGRDLRLTQINAHLRASSRQITFDLDGRSDLTHTLHATFQMDPKQLDGQGRLVLTRLDTDRLIRFIRTEPHPFSLAAFPDLKIAFKTERFETLSVDLDAANPGRMDLHWQDGHTRVRAKNLSASLTLAKDHCEWICKAFELGDPALNVSGRLSVANPQSAGEPRINLDMDAQTIDLTALRRHARALFRNQSAIQGLSRIIRQGRLEQVSLRNSGGNWHEVLDPQKFQVYAKALDGVVRVPGLSAAIEHLQGEFTIQEGLLRGEKLKADMGPTKARQGVLLLGLSGQSRRFALSTDLTLDLPQALTVLRPLVKNPKAASALDGIQALTGIAQGRLKLGDRLDKLQFQVNLSDIQMMLHHLRLPYPLQITGAKLNYASNRLAVEKVAGRFKDSSFSGLTGSLDWTGPLNFNGSLSSGFLDLSLQDLYQWARAEGQVLEKLKGLETIDGKVRITELQLKGPAATPETWHYQAKGNLKKIGLRFSGIAFPLNLSDGQFSLAPRAISVALKGLKFLDTDVNLFASLNDYRSGIDLVKAAVNGRLGSATHAWLNERYHLPAWFTLSKTLDISRAEIEWHRQGKTLYAADLAMEDQGRATLSGSFCGRAWQVENLFYEDRNSRFNAALAVAAGDYNLSFDGYLDGRTLGHLAPQNRVKVVRLAGDFRLRLSMEKILSSRFEGRMELDELYLDWPGKPPLVCHRMSAKGSRGRLEFQTLDLTVEETQARLTGYLLALPEVAVVDLTLSSPAIDLDRIVQRLASLRQTGQPEKKHEFKLKLPIQGIVRLDLARFTVRGLTWKGLSAAVAINQQQADIRVTRAELCGILTPARLTVAPMDLQLTTLPRAHALAIQQTSDCLWNRTIQMDGTFDLQGEVRGQGKGFLAPDSLNGDLAISARNGRIYRMNTLAKIFGFLNVTEIFAGRMPDLQKEGFGYNTIELKARIDQGRLHIEEGLLDGRSLTLTLQGVIDPLADRIDLTVLVAPFKTIDRIIQKIPLVNYILAGSLVSIPLKVEGNLKDPYVVPLAPTAVGESLLNLTKRTLKAPFKLIQP